jgi:hypothetical protein
VLHVFPHFFPPDFALIFVHESYITMARPKKNASVDEKPVKEKNATPKPTASKKAKSPAQVRAPMTKWQVAQVWRAYQMREGPQNLGESAIRIQLK